MCLADFYKSAGQGTNLRDVPGVGCLVTIYYALHLSYPDSGIIKLFNEYIHEVLFKA
jgi:hypothetical protein